MNQDARDDYCVTYDQDPKNIEQISGFIQMKNIAFHEINTLKQQASSLSPVAAFIDIPAQDPRPSTQLIQHLKLNWPTTPIIITTDFSSEEVIADALTAGADDFVQKPFNKQEIKARFLARVKQQNNQPSTELIKFSDLSLNILARELEGPSGKRYLSPTEVSIMKILFAANGGLVTRETIKQKCWGNVVVTNNALDRHIHGVRAAIKTLTQSIKMRSVYGKGYILEKSAFETTSIAS